MNLELQRLAAQLELDAPAQRALRWRFGHGCVSRISQNLEDAEAIGAFESFGACLDGEPDEATLGALSGRVARLARRHRGSDSVDGARHAAVSATHALAQALAGRALDAAAYAAYSMVYAYAAYAVGDPSAFDEEHRAQCELLRRLAAAERPLAAPG